MKRDFTQYKIYLLLITVAAILWAGKIQYSLPQYANIDLAKYREMALASPGLNLTIPHPYVYRLFAPWLAGLFPINIDLSFYLLNSVSLIALAFVFFRILSFHGFDEKLSLFITSAFVFNRYFFQFLAFDYYQLSDTVAYFLLFSSFLLMAEKRWTLFGMTLILGILTREAALLIIPVGYVYLYEKRFDKKDFLWLTIYSLLAIFIFLVIRVLIPNTSQENYFTQITYGLSSFFSYQALTKRFLIPITPFMVIPFIFLKDFYDYFKKHFYLIILFIFVAISSMFGNDFERLMTAASPVFYLFLAYIISKYLNSNLPKSFTVTFYALTILTVLFSSLYHLWGIIRLPSREITMQVTLLSDLLMFIIFMVLKYQGSLTKEKTIK
ncbi:hypothetical protein BMS3Abin04_01793 [bacterium BMS3Abin04]|nr:hypothetical protein BMS3Abin04_01793 [bacterium BMS3Abin04]